MTVEIVEHIIAPPRSGKSTRCVKTIEAFLRERPDDDVAYISYDAQVAHAHTRHLHIDTRNPNPYPLCKGSALGGRGFDLIILDDLLKDVEEASSLTILRSTLHWLQSVVPLKLCPNGRVFSIASDEQQMRMVVSAFGHLGVQVRKEPGIWSSELEQQCGPALYRRMYRGEPAFTPEL